MDFVPTRKQIENLVFQRNPVDDGPVVSFLLTSLESAIGRSKFRFRHDHFDLACKMYTFLVLEVGGKRMLAWNERRCGLDVYLRWMVRRRLQRILARDEAKLLDEAAQYNAYLYTGLPDRSSDYLDDVFDRRDTSKQIRRRLVARLPTDVIDSVFEVQVHGAPPSDVAARREITTRSLRNWQDRVFRAIEEIVKVVLAPLIFITTLVVVLALLNSSESAPSAQPPAVAPEPGDDGRLPLPGWIQDAREIYGCFLRDSPSEPLALTRTMLSCRGRDEKIQKFAVQRLARHSDLERFYTVLLESARVPGNSTITRFNNALRGLAISPESVHRLVADVEDAYRTSSEILSAVSLNELDKSMGTLADECEADMMDWPGRPTPPTITIESVATERCHSDVGWEADCDAEEIIVVWTLIGHNYLSYGLSPQLNGIRRGHPSSFHVRLEPSSEVGEPDADLVFFFALVELDPGGETFQRLAEVTAAFGSAAQALLEAERCASNSSLGFMAEVFSLLLRVSAGEHDVEQAQSKVLRCRDGDCSGRQTFEIPTVDDLPYLTKVSFE